MRLIVCYSLDRICSSVLWLHSLCPDDMQACKKMKSDGAEVVISMLMNDCVLYLRRFLYLKRNLCSGLAGGT